jgi:hypothetical protein
MKSNIFSLLLLAAGMIASSDAVAQITADNVTLERNGNLMKVDMDLNLSNLKVKSNRALLITPSLVAPNDTLDLKSIGIYGRRRYYYYLRNDKSMISSDNIISYKAGNAPDVVTYQTIIPYSTWQSGASLVLKTSELGCCNGLIAENISDLGATYNDPNLIVTDETVAFVPELIFVKPEAQHQKEIVFAGSAYVQFPVNQTVIYDNFRDNAREINKIRGLIDTLKMEKDVEIESVSLKGYASPEGSYANNERLAKGRVEALKTYVNNLYHFAPGVVTTAYEPEDWQGLRKFVAASNIANKDAILAIIDSDMLPDAKDAKIRQTYPDDYAFLLQVCYPTLRHTDYAIACKAKQYVDPAEIEATLKRNPRIVSLNEIYLLANTHETGSDEFNSLCETAVHLYPDDPIANLNVANIAIRRGELNKASQYLDKAGNTPQAIYTRGVVAFLNGDTVLAKGLLQSAAAQGISQATDLLNQIQ